MTMPAMHKDMHDGAREYKQVWECSGHMHQMFFQQKVAGDRADDEQS